MLSEEKEQKSINTNAITRHNAIAIFHEQQPGRSTIIFRIFQDFLMFYQICLSPQVKQNTIISNKHGI